MIFYHPQPMHVFLHLNNSSGNKWFNFKIPFRNAYTIIPFQACSPTRHLKPHHAQILSCSGSRVGVCFIIRPVFLAFQLSSLVFYTTLCTRFGLPYPLITGIPQCVYTHCINPMGIHLLCCVHGNKHIRTHDAIHNTFVAIT